MKLGINKFLLDVSFRQMRNLLAIGYYMFVSVISKSIDETDPMKILIHFQ